MILYLPSAIAFGYVTVTLVYLLSHAGVSVSEIAGLVALLFFPQTWKVLWAPIVDTTLTSKRWYVISAAATGLLTLGTAYVPAKEGSLWLLDVLVLALSIASCASSMATESLMAHTTAPDQQGRAGGWLQAGNLGGGGLGGGAGLWLGQHVAAWSAGVVLGLACVACCATLLLVTQPSRARGVLSYRAEIIVVGRDVWGVVRSRAGFLALLLFVLPIGTGSASNLWAAVADDWRASADTVALVNGVLGGLIAMVGCFVGGYLCDVIDRTTGYVLFGIALAVCAVAMAIGPRTSAMFVILTCVYFFFTGCIYAAFTGVVLETIGTGAAATKYNLMSSIGNIPIAYVTLIDGWAQTRLGSGGMLYTEAALGIVGVIVFIGIALATRSRAVAADDRSPRIA